MDYIPPDDDSNDENLNESSSDYEQQKGPDLNLRSLIHLVVYSINKFYLYNLL